MAGEVVAVYDPLTSAVNGAAEVRAHNLPLAGTAMLMTWGELRDLLADPARPFVPDGRASIQDVLAGVSW